MPAITAEDLTEREGMRVLDVRDDRDFEEGHYPLVTHLFVGYVDDHPDRGLPPLAKDEQFAVTCSIGHRAGLGMSRLRRKGFVGAQNLLGGMRPNSIGTALGIRTTIQ